MTVATAQRFATEYAQNEQFRAQLKAASTPEDKQQIMAGAGFGDVTKEDVAALQTGELSEEDLTPVAGAGGIRIDPMGGNPGPISNFDFDEMYTDCGWGDF